MFSNIFRSKPFRFFLKATTYTGLTLATGASLLYIFQDKLLYFPNRPNRTPHTNPVGFRHPGEVNLTYEDVYIKTPDGLKLHGWFIKTSEPKAVPTIVVFQGRTGNIGYRVPFLAALSKYCPANLLIAGYRGYSNSEGIPTEKGIKVDSVTIMDYIFSRQDIDLNKVFVLGHSMGGAITVHAVTETSYNVRGVILENTFTMISDVVKARFPILTGVLPYLLENHWESVKCIHQIKAPMLFISGMRDTLIPPLQMKQLYDAAQASVFKEIVEIENGTHNETWSLGEAQYFQGIKGFMDKALAHQGENP